MERLGADEPSDKDEMLNDCVAAVDGFATTVTLCDPVVTAANVFTVVVVTVTVGVDSSTMVVAPPDFAISSARIAASIGCSSWVTKTDEPAISSRRASISAGEIVVAMPGQTMIALFPVSSSMKM